MQITFPDSAIKYMGLQCNSVVTDYTECAEFTHALPILRDLRPTNVLELGAGLGRGSVFLHNVLDWDSTVFHLLDGDSGEKQVAGMHERLEKHFYNSLKATEEFCLANGIPPFRLRVLNAEKAINLGDDMFDLCFSIKAIGFHWPLLEHLEMLAPHMRKGAFLIFETRSTKRDKYEQEVRWKRCTSFVRKQVESVIRNKNYSLYRCIVDDNHPLLIIRRK